MPPFQYDGYRSPYVGTIADMIRAKGQIQAQAAQNIGQTVGGFLNGVGQYQADAPKRELLATQVEGAKLSLADQKKQMEDRATMDRIYQGAYGLSPSQQPGFVGPTQPGMPQAGSLPPGMTKTADGVLTPDRKWLTEQMASAGLGSQIPSTIASLTKADEAAATLAKLKGDINNQTRAGLSALGASVEASGNTSAGFHLATLMAVHNGFVTPDQVAPYLSRVQADPSQIQIITREMQALEHPPERSKLPEVGTPAYQDMVRARELMQQNGGAPQQTPTPAQPTIEPDPAITASGSPLNALPQQTVANSGALADQGNLPQAAAAPTGGAPPAKPLSEADAYAKARLEREPVQHVSFRLDGKEVEGTFNPRDGGKYFYNGQDVTARAQHIPAAAITINAANEARNAPNRAVMSQGLNDGTVVPSMLSRRSADFNATLADASRLHMEQTGKPLNFVKLELDYKAAQKFVSSLNGTNMVKFKALGNSVVNTIDEVRTLAEELKQGGVQKWNQVKRDTVLQVYGNTPQSELAVRYVSAVNALKEEYANLANGGFAPTDPAWKLANEQINGNYGFRDLNASLLESQRLINYRLSGFTDLSPMTIGGNGGSQGGDSGATINVGGFTVRVVK